MKGFGRILEAVFASIILLSFLVSLNSFSISLERNTQNLYPFIEHNPEIRKCSCTLNISCIEEKIYPFVQNFSVMICNRSNCIGDVGEFETSTRFNYIFACNNTVELAIFVKD